MHFGRVVLLNVLNGKDNSSSFSIECKDSDTNYSHKIWWHIDTHLQRLTIHNVIVRNCNN